MNPIPVVIDRSSPVPLYFQLARQLESAILAGRIPKGSFLDNELDLAEQWQVSRPTVRQAMQELVDNGMLVRRRGIGTQVVSDQFRRPVKLSSLFDDLVEQGRTPHTTVLVHEAAHADAAVAVALQVEPGSPVVRLERLRSVDGRPLAVMRNWLPVDVGEGLDETALTTAGLYSLLRARGIRPHSAMQRIGARVADPADAKRLQLARGAALLTVYRVMQDQTGRPVEVGDHVYDAAHYSVELSVLEP